MRWSIPTESQDASCMKPYPVEAANSTENLPKMQLLRKPRNILLTYLLFLQQLHMIVAQLSEVYKCILLCQGDGQKIKEQLRSKEPPLLIKNLPPLFSQFKKQFEGQKGLQRKRDREPTSKTWGKVTPKNTPNKQTKGMTGPENRKISTATPWISATLHPAISQH